MLVKPRAVIAVMISLLVSAWSIAPNYAAKSDSLNFHGAVTSQEIDRLKVEDRFRPPDPGGVKRKQRSLFAGAGTALAAFPFELAADRTAPSEFRIFRKGANPSEKGVFIFNETSALSVMETYTRLNKPMRFDYNHGTLLESPPTPEASLSAGTFVPEVRAGELWATKCNWTARAASLLAAGEYGEFSPYFDHDKDGVVTRLINCALTNLPALNDIESLVAASATPTKDDDMEACTACAALNTRLSAMDEECKALKAKLSTFEKDKDDEKTKASALTALTGKPTYPETLGVITGWKTKAEGYDKLAAESAEREATALRAELTAVLDGGVKDGKIPPASKPAIEASALQLGGGKASKEGVAFLTALVAGMPKLIATTETPVPAGTLALSKERLEIARQMGRNAKDIIEFETKRLGQTT